MPDEPFAGGVEAPESDPFADTNFEQEDPFAEEAAKAEEGEAAVEPSKQEQSEALPNATVGSDGQPIQKITEAPVPGVPVVDGEGKKIDPPPSGSQAATQVTAPEGEAPSAPSPATAASEPPDEPDELKDDKGKVTHRRYLVFKPVGQNRWEQVSWWEADDGSIVPPKTGGAVRKTSCLVRTKDDALATAYAALGLGKDEHGAEELVAVTTHFWVVKTVRPTPIQPIRSRLSIT